MTPKHPTSRPVLPVGMAVMFFFGLIFIDANDVGFSAANLFAAFSFGCFGILFAVYWAGWLWREHELWREARRVDQDRPI